MDESHRQYKLDPKRVQGTFPGLVVRTLHPPLQRIGVQSLVGELISHTPVYG